MCECQSGKKKWCKVEYSYTGQGWSGVCGGVVVDLHHMVGGRDKVMCDIYIMIVEKTS